MIRPYVWIGLATVALAACPGGASSPAGDDAAPRDSAVTLADGEGIDGGTSDGGGGDAGTVDAESAPDATIAPDTACVPTAELCNGVDDDCDGAVDESCTCPARTRASVASPPAGASWRRGGGYGYPDTVDPKAPCTTVVSSAAALEQALKTAKSGWTVYVKDGASLNLTGKSLCVPAGVWLAGGRGRGTGPGALLYTTVTTKTPILKACGKGVRITGLRLWGADLTQCPPSYATKTCSGTYDPAHCRDCEPASYGVVVAGSSGAELELDNCEAAGWSFAAVALSDGPGNKVHHSYLHHTQRQGLGYGVMLGGTSSVVSALIEGNRFDYYRHAVAASGSAGQEYEARQNLALEHTIGHVYDMHGLDEHLHNGTSVAGKRILIHDNSIFPAAAYSFLLRGKPTEGAWFYDNCTARSASTATLQKLFFGNFWIDQTPGGASAPSAYSQSPQSCETVRWCYSLGGQGPWRYALATSLGLGNVGLGDFDGDGRTDAFRTSGGAWYVSAGASAAWKKINTSSYTLANLRFGDFNGDGKTDVFSASGGSWRYSRGGASSWTTLRAASEGVSSLGFGDFDGDGKTDAFKTEGGAWYWSSGAKAAWAKRNTSSYTLADLRFGDFDGDGKTDAFRADGGAWYISSAAAGPWKQVNSSSYALSGLVLGDFDGDGKADAMHSGANEWRFSAGAASGWKRRAIESLDVTGLAVGDFDGDGRADLLRAGCY